MVITARVDTVTWSTRLATVDGFPAAVPIARHIVSGQLIAGDTAVIVVEGGQAWLLGVLGDAPPPPPDPEPDPEPDPGTGADPAPPPRPPAPPPQPTYERRVFRPTWSGTWRGGWRSDTSDLYQGDWTGRGINQGACWWGRLPTAIEDATLTLVRGSGAGVAAAQAPTMTLLAGTTRPAGAATVLATTPGPALARGRSAEWSLPEAWVAQMTSGAAGGIGITSGSSRTPYLALVVSGLGMTLALTVRRT